MAQSGKVADTSFADGFLATVRDANRLNLDVTLQHWCPAANLRPPLGRIKGDLGLLFHSPPQLNKTLLIVEREGSGPGNERNILKWFQAVRGAHPIILEAETTRKQIDCNQAAIMLLLAFCRPDNWLTSDFDKACAFCEVLAQFTNEYSVANRLSMTTAVLCYPKVVTDWRQCGRYFAEQALKLI